MLERRSQRETFQVKSFVVLDNSTVPAGVGAQRRALKLFAKSAEPAKALV
jgi:hypothetical protein